MPDVLTASPSERKRFPAVEGARNFRDLGGYRTSNGRSVRWGLLYRSGSLAGLTPAGRARLTELNLRGICDLRSTSERMHEPVDWCEAAGLSYWSRDYGSSFGELRTLMASPLPTAAAARNAMILGYSRLPYEQAPAYRELFRQLAAGEVPLVFNCSAGKDRAGTAAALVLTALGVPPEIVIEDYVLTDQAINLREALLTRRSTILVRQPAGVIDAILRADADYINVALEAAGATSGSFNSYLQQHLGVGPSELEKIKESLLH